MKGSKVGSPLQFLFKNIFKNALLRSNVKILAEKKTVAIKNNFGVKNYHLEDTDLKVTKESSNTFTSAKFHVIWGLCPRDCPSFSQSLDK